MGFSAESIEKHLHTFWHVCLRKINSKTCKGYTSISARKNVQVLAWVQIRHRNMQTPIESKGKKNYKIQRISAILFYFNSLFIYWHFAIYIHLKVNTNLWRIIKYYLNVWCSTLKRKRWKGVEIIIITAFQQIIQTIRQMLQTSY